MKTDTAEAKAGGVELILPEAGRSHKAGGISALTGIACELGAKAKPATPRA